METMAMRGTIAAIVVALLWFTEIATATWSHPESVNVNISLVNDLPEERVDFTCWSRFGKYLWHKVEAGGEYRLTVSGGNRVEDEFSCGADWGKRFVSWPVVEAGRSLRTDEFWKVQYDGVYKRYGHGSECLWLFYSPWSFNI